MQTDATPEVPGAFFYENKKDSSVQVEIRKPRFKFPFVMIVNTCESESQLTRPSYIYSKSLEFFFHRI